MNNSFLKAPAIAAFAAIGLFSIASAAPTSSLVRFDEKRSEVVPVRQFRGEIPWGIRETTSSLPDHANSRNFIKPSVAKPSVGFDRLSTYDFLEAPDGSTWFYTTDYDIETVNVSQWYKEEYLRGYTFTIFDSQFNEVGTVSDRITLLPGETKAAMAVLDPYVSFRFFNSDALPEVMVYLGMKTGAEYNYQVNYYNKVYSIGGEKDADGYDKCIAVMKGRCADAINAATPGGEENVFYTFVEDIYPDPSDFGFNQYLEYLNAARTVVTVYNSATADPHPRVALQKDIFLSRYPGDTTSGTYFISRNEKGIPYFIFSQYEKPYLLDPTGMAGDESATPGNSLLIDVFSFAGGKETHISTTRIPVDIPDIDGQVNYAFYSIGSVAWKEDIDMAVNGSPSAPAFVVARDVTTAANLEDIISGYYVFDNTGSKVATIAENAQSISLLAPIKGVQPQTLIVNETADDFSYSFVELHSGKIVMTLPRVFEGESLKASCQRVPTHNGYEYAFETAFDDRDADGNIIKKVVWISPENGGTLIRTDLLNLGPDVVVSTLNLFPESLSPYLYDSDDAMEYAVLVKRTRGGADTTENEFIIVDDNGEWYAHFDTAHGRGIPTSFNILEGPQSNFLMMVFAESDGFNVDFYDLPFLSHSDDSSSGIDDIVAGTDNSISFNGHSISAPGSIEIYNMGGLAVAKGAGSLSVASFPSGTYIAVSTDSSGSRSSLKFVVK